MNAVADIDAFPFAIIFDLRRPSTIITLGVLSCHASLHEAYLDSRNRSATANIQIITALLTELSNFVLQSSARH